MRRLGGCGIRGGGGPRPAPAVSRGPAHPAVTKPEWPGGQASRQSGRSSAIGDGRAPTRPPTRPWPNPGDRANRRTGGRPAPGRRRAGHRTADCLGLTDARERRSRQPACAGVKERIPRMNECTLAQEPNARFPVLSVVPQLRRRYEAFFSFFLHITRYTRKRRSDDGRSNAVAQHTARQSASGGKQQTKDVAENRDILDH